MKKSIFLCLFFGCFGMTFEIFFVAFSNIIMNTPLWDEPLWSLTGKTYVWMFPIYILIPVAMGPIIKFLNEKRATQIDLVYLSSSMVKLKYQIPLLELVSGFYDSLKSISQGFASLDYKILDFENGDLVKLDILVNGVVVDSFSSILSKENSEYIGRNRVKKLSKLIPRQQFDIPIQAAIGSRIIARETIKALRKDVTAKLYGGDVTRKRKLLEKQKEGKKKMRNIGQVEVPKEAFKEFLKE